MGRPDHVSVNVLRKDGPARLDPDDHDFGGLDEGGRLVADFEPQFADRVGGNDRGDALAADR